MLAIGFYNRPQCMAKPVSEFIGGGGGASVGLAFNCTVFSVVAVHYLM